MTEVGIRALKQNASAVVAAVEQGDDVTITDRGRPVARLSSLRGSPFDRLVASGLARRARRSLRQLPEPIHAPGLSDTLQADRDDARY